MHISLRRTRPGAALFATLLALCAATSSAADYIVDFDHEVDFATFRTFTIRDTRMGIDRPETSNSIVIGRTTDTIRTALAARGLRETTEGADLLVDWQVRGQGMFIGPGGQPRPTTYGQGGSNPGAQPLTFIETTVVLDMTAASSGLLVWRGVLRNKDRDAGEVAKNLPGYAKKLLTAYPKARK
jgi:hypothetical protein